MSEAGWTWDAQFQQARIDELQREYADAQATIAALQARVRELEADQYKQGFADALEKVASDWASKEFRGHDEIQGVEVQAFLDTRHVHYEECRGVKPLQSQLTQRTAELEAVRKWKLELCNLTPGGSEFADDPAYCAQWVRKSRENQHNVILDKYREAKALKAELERVMGERDHAKKMEAVQKEVADNQTWHVQKLRALILGLPKVEGNWTVSCALAVAVVTDGIVRDISEAVAAIVQHRQGMEG